MDLEVKEFAGLFYAGIDPTHLNEFDYLHMKNTPEFNAWRASKTQVKITLKIMNNKIKIAWGIVVISLLVNFLLIYKHLKPIKQIVEMDFAMEKQANENDSVTVDIIKSNTWVMDKKSHIDQHSMFAWKLKSGNYIIRFNYVPDSKYYKWNEGEIVPNDLILELLAIDELIHETYNLHKQRQK